MYIYIIVIVFQLWLNPLKTIGRQLKLSNNTLTFRVKHFPANPHKIESADVR